MLERELVSHRDVHTTARVRLRLARNLPRAFNSARLRVSPQEVLQETR